LDLEKFHDMANLTKEEKETMDSEPLIEARRSSSSSSNDSVIRQSETKFYQNFTKITNFTKTARERQRRKSKKSHTSRKPSPKRSTVPDGTEDFELPFIKAQGRLKLIQGYMQNMGAPKYIKISYQQLLEGCNVSLQNQKFYVGDKNDPGNCTY